MNIEILIFGGTIEGRQVSDYLISRGTDHTLCVATEYGEEVLTPRERMEVHQGRMDAGQMLGFMRQRNYRAVVDATHPYAVEVSKNVREACEKAGIPYLRYLRQTSAPREQDDGQIIVNSTREAAEYLESRDGGIFLTTGSKELHIFTEVIPDKSRLFARVLPSAEVIASCRGLGLEGKQICGMQGPFSADMNEAMMRQAGSRFLVTKETGISGGYPEKLEAARRLGVQPVIIRRPRESGYNWEELCRALEPYIGESPAEARPEAAAENPAEARPEAAAENPAETRPEAAAENPAEARPEAAAENPAEAAAGIPAQIRQEAYAEISAEPRMESAASAPPEKEKTRQKRTIRQISCVGIGMGILDTLTHEAARAIREADILFGARRIMDSVRAMMPLQADTVTEYEGKKIAAYLAEHPGYQRPVILMSGDVGFYSGARGVEQAFAGERVHFYCGISSVVYFASKIPTAWQDARLVSAHGKQVALLNQVNRYPKLIMLVSGREDVERICRELHEAGQDQVTVTVGTNLSYPNERIDRGKPEDFLSCTTAGLHIMMLENPRAEHIVTPGIPDEAFVRGKVPMTKEEIRILSVAKLRLKENSVVYDVGAGTGSVSIEMARLCPEGTVYAIERNPEGIGLIRENSRKMCLSNVVTVEGTAPEAMEGLPAPTHAFIGGTAGNMREIVALLRQKNPGVRIVVNTIALESISEMMAVLKELEIKDADIVQLSAARSRTLGHYHMMTGLNPVYIVSFGGSGGRT